EVGAAAVRHVDKFRFNFQTATTNRSRKSSGAGSAFTFFPFGQKSEGWSAEQRNHQFTPCGVSCLFA
ncbi:MAG: hypothetical protein AB1490_02875, partial [Pseudomonadota bacterium]